jgi:hypothetical protein
MSNPWLKKNPFMSMWSSGANSIAGSMQGQARRHAVTAMTNATNDLLRIWASALTVPRPAKKRRR